ncbi:hypothetical protein ACFYNV_29785 [Streptomyces albidoflavus]
MSGCCGQGPVIVSGAAATPRVDAEGTLLCDVLPDGTVAAAVLVEAVYDTSSGVRLGTRTVDPVTGAVYVPTGTLQPCASGSASSDCAALTTPTATVGLCLADGTPIAVTVVRDCDGVVTSEGWINLTTGAWSAGTVPAGAVACGESRSITVSGTFCDIDGAGDVVGLVLVEYSYAVDGTIDSVRLVDAITGGTYVPAGTVTVCPAGVEQPERDILQLCDTATDGTVTAFVRDYARDENGALVGFSDYTLDGTPYTPAGAVGVCYPADPDPCRSSTTLTLCDTTPVDTGGLVAATATDPTPYFQTGDGVTKLVVLADPQPFFDGGPITVDGPPGGETTADPTHRYTAAVLTLPEGTCPPCGDWPDTMTLTVAATVTNTGPAVGQGVTGRFTLYNGTTILDANQITATPVGGTAQFTVTADVSRADLLAGTIAIEMDLETKHQGLKAWTADGFTVSLTFPQAGCGTPFLRTIRRDCVTGDLVDVLDTGYDGLPYTPVGEVASCTAHSTCGGGGQSGDASTCEQCAPLVLCDVVPGSAPVPFLRTVCHDCTGGTVAVTDTMLDGVTAYVPAGTVTDCASVGDCPSSYSTECWSLVTAQASYDNTRGGTCGQVDPASMAACAGNWRITSWIIDGTEQITGGPAEFVATGCGGNADQFHGAWAAALGVIDPSSSWEAAYNGSCLFFIRTASVDPNRVYGQMVMFRTEAPTQVYTLTPATSRTETVFTKRFTQECDGSTTVSWLDADGVEIEEPEGDLTACDGGISPTDPDSGQAVDTGVRAVTGTATQDLAAEFPGLQSVSLSALAGAVEATMTDGSAVSIPAGVTLTWSVTKDTDTALSAASFAGADATTTFLLNWTYTP